MKTIYAQMVADWMPEYEGNAIPKVIKSDHPQFDVGTRLDWGFVQVALDEGYRVSIKPLSESDKALLAALRETRNANHR